MAWSAPMTAVSGATFTAAQFNQYVRDNLNETATAKATAASQLFVSTGVNALAARVPSTTSVATAQSLATNVGYADLTTAGPAITVTCGTIAIVFFAAGMSVAANDSSALTSVGVTGASSVAASDTWAIQMDGITANNVVRYGMTHVFTGLTAGTNTFTVKYKAGGSASTWRNREIGVLPL
jgi:hypothetical protein